MVAHLLMLIRRRRGPVFESRVSVEIYSLVNPAFDPSRAGKLRTEVVALLYDWG